MHYIIEYNHDWPKRFVRITGHVKEYLPESCLFHHIGSTSVPGMPGKDIIDLDIEYAAGSLDTVISGLKEAGYEHEGDLGISGREVFKPALKSGAASLPAHHLYACEAGAYELLKHLAYRDYLIANPDRAEWLATQKIAGDASAESRDEYIEKKSCSYAVITEESMKWADKALQRPPDVSTWNKEKGRKRDARGP